MIAPRQIPNVNGTGEKTVRKGRFRRSIHPQRIKKIISIGLDINFHSCFDFDNNYINFSKS